MPGRDLMAAGFIPHLSFRLVVNVRLSVFRALLAQRQKLKRFKHYQRFADGEVKSADLSEKAQIFRYFAISGLNTRGRVSSWDSYFNVESVQLMMRLNQSVS